MATQTEKKSKSRAKGGGGEHKRKYEEEVEEIEVAAVQEPTTKKDKKKKKKNKENQEQEEIIETPNGVEEEIKNKKKKKDKKEKKEENLSNGSAEKVNDNGGGGEVREITNEGVTVSGKDVTESKYRALKSFSEAGLPEKVMECCKNFDKPSPIQSNSWPFLLNGRDFIGIAKTGSGKTLAFGIPMMMHILSKRKDKSSKNPLCLVLSPTRELAQQANGTTRYMTKQNPEKRPFFVDGSELLNIQQMVILLIDPAQDNLIFDVLSDAGKPSNIRSVCVYGGTSKGPQKSALRSGVDIVIGTPGRLRDLMEEGVCNLNEVSFVVLDEADRMLDMGFEQEVRSILSVTSSIRQMVMFSATWPLAVNQLSQEFMDPNPVKVVVGSEDLAANHDVMQIVEVLEDRARDERLVTLLEKYHKSRRNRVLVFVLYKKEASRVENMLQRRGWKVCSISGDKAQNARTEALALFKDGTCPLLIATDVAARGLDIPDVEVVINYSFPLTTEDYVHRIGRTGRAGKKGVAHTFFMKENKALSGELINVLKEAGQNVPTFLMNFGTHVKKKESKLYGAHFREITADAPKATKITFNNSDDED